MARALTLALVLLLAAACDQGGDDNSPGSGDGDGDPSLIGTWGIVGTLVTSSAENPYDPNAPKPGQQMTDTWTIATGATGLDLTTPKGTVPGEATSGGAHFSVQFLWEAGVWITVTIDVMQSTASTIKGTEEIVYTGTNSVTGEPVPLGREAWTFEGTRQ